MPSRRGRCARRDDRRAWRTAPGSDAASRRGAPPTSKGESPLRTLIRAAATVAWQGGRQVHLSPAELVVADGAVEWVGRSYPGTADALVDASRCLLAPGFVNAHCHVTTPATRSFRENCGNPLFYMSGLYEMLPISWRLAPEGARVVAEATLIELLRGGSTTALVLGSSIPETVADLARRLGIRLYLSPGYKDGDWSVEAGRRVGYAWDEAAGRRGLERNVAFVRDCGDRGLVRGFLGPLQADTVSPQLLRQTRAWADRLGCRVQIHAAQSLQEFQEIARRHGRTPVGLLDDCGLLGADVSLAHAIFVAGHSWTATPAAGDLERLASTGTAVAHCPMVFARSGVALETLPRYLRAGVPIALGTDTVPQDMIQEMRLAALVGKLLERDARVATAADVFDAATLGGARLLGRDDLGRLAAGARADLLAFDLDRVTLASARDPLRTLVYSASPADLAWVMVDGRRVVERGRVLGADEPAVAAALEATVRGLWAALPDVDWAGRDLDRLSPPSLPRWEDARPTA